MDLNALNAQVPKILSKRRNKVSKLFTVEQLDLQFSNNTTMTYEQYPLMVKTFYLQVNMPVVLNAMS